MSQKLEPMIKQIDLSANSSNFCDCIWFYSSVFPIPLWVNLSSIHTHKNVLKPVFFKATSTQHKLDCFKNHEYCNIFFHQKYIQCTVQFSSLNQPYFVIIQWQQYPTDCMSLESKWVIRCFDIQSVFNITLFVNKFMQKCVFPRLITIYPDDS